MPLPKDGKVPVDVVEIDSSDDEGGGATARRSAIISNTLPKSHSRAQFIVPKVEFAADVASSGSTYLPLESRSFWKAGDYDTGLIKITNSQGELQHARVHPKFLHSNATSHKWAFGAIAELLDNAIDEICNGATYVKVDRIYNKRDNSPALLFQDDGGGMDPEGIRKCMSLGYSSKTSKKTIGQYGNGFKTSTMRLGADVIVLSRACRSSRATQSIGLLSYTFLRRTGQDDVIVPMIDFDISDNWAEPIIYNSQNDWSTNLKTILEWSPFESKDDLLLQFEDIGSHGTKIIIYNLWLNDEGIYELNFDEDEEDIRLRDEANRGGISKTPKRVLELQSHISYRIRYSLRAYASILYQRKFTNFKIILRGKPVEQFNIADDLKHTEVITYRPQHAAAFKEISVETKIGFIKEAPALGIAGFNIYHKNRLIRPFWKVTADGSSRGNGVVGVLEANFIEPAHDKQDFERSILFFRLEMRLKQMVSEYWKGHCHLVGHQPDKSSPYYVPKNATVQPQLGVSKTDKQQQTGGNVNLTRSFVSLPASSLRGLDGEQIINQQRTSYDIELPRVQPVNGSAAESAQEGTDMNSSGFMSIDQICEENIQLFMRCEENIQKENELEHTIEELEKELEETKKKCAQLSSQLESQKRQKLLAQQTQNA